MLLAVSLCPPGFGQQQRQPVSAHYQRAQQALAARDYPRAAEEFEALVRVSPNMAEAHANLGTVYYAQGRYPEATAAFNRALQLRPGMKGVEPFLGMSQARQGRLREARSLLEKGFQNPIAEEWRLEAGLLLADVYQRANEWEKLQQTVASLQRTHGTNAEVLYLAYRVHASLAARAVAGLVKNAPGSARVHQIAAEMLESEGDYPAAVTEYRKALELEPKLPGGHRALGVALMNKATDPASREEAEELFRRELALNPNDAAAEYQLGEMLWLSSKPGEALVHYNRALELQPEFPDALIAAGKVRTSLGEASAAIALLEKAVALDPQNDVARYRLAQALQGAGQRERAQKELAEFRRLRSALESLRSLYRQIQENRITAQKADEQQ